MARPNDDKLAFDFAGEMCELIGNCDDCPVTNACKMGNNAWSEWFKGFLKMEDKKDE